MKPIVSTRPLHFLNLRDFAPSSLRAMIEAAKSYKTDRKGARRLQPLAGRTLVMLFESPSTRTRLSFDVAMRNLGGETIVVSGRDMQLGRGETIADTARVMSRYCDAVMIRILDHEALVEFADNASVPVINALTRQSHPCQVMADVLTFEEHVGAIGGRTLAWVGDSNNMLNSFIEAAGLFGFRLNIAVPESRAPDAGLMDWARAAGGEIRLCHRAEEAVEGAECIVTDTWTSMGEDEASRKAKIELLMPFQVTRALMDLAAPDAIFMHCLPAHRGEEVTADVIDGPRSVVFDEAENRVYVQSAILAHCLGV